jgi:uracil-DNA glycosylase
MFAAIRADYPSFAPPPKNGGLLTPWADRGVLMLNTCLTVREGEANSHAKKGWEAFTQKVVDLVAKRNSGAVFLAWGNAAKERCKKVNRERHCVLGGVHPSPLAGTSFKDCHHFKLANDWLKQRHGEGSEIDWSLNVEPVEAGI